MDLYRGLNSYAEAVAILTHGTAGGFAPIPNEVPAKPPKDACDAQKGTDGETRYSQDSAWDYFMQKNHTGDNAIVEYTTNGNTADQFSRPLTIGIEIADAWCYSFDNDQLESGVMIFRRAPFIKIYGLKISKPQIHASRSKNDTTYFTMLQHLALKAQIKIFP
ncbi:MULTISPECIES: hypothetical protein [Chromobacterium]|uniref:hypothetical protein n=1 Tax=Chromobacterium TaxID=535 RepID=UPI00188868AB|nr:MULTISPECIES: hypothetical protein [Chromobacterium]QOZ83543.1 hypothetical protein DXT74_10955 [Chromobacterium sp. Rain0013]WON83662.1 hypothetical protein OK026_21455 [Chromobacterium haemolyticum]